MEEELIRLVDAGKLDRQSATKITQFKPGAFVQHKSWGVGRVESWDLIGDRILVDFTGRPRHGMKLQFAASALTALPEDHILADRFRNLGALQRLAEEDPVTLMHRTLSSYGNTMKLDDIDAVIKGTVVPEGKFKTWWDATKKKLRMDQRFVVPSKRNLPMELRADEADPAAALANDVLNATDLRAKAKAVDNILKNPALFEGNSELLQTVALDLNDAAAKSQRLLLSQALELILCRMDLQSRFEGLQPDGGQLDLAEVLRDERHRLDETLRTLGVSRQRQVLEAFPQAFGDDYFAVVVSLLNNAGMRSIGELTKFLFDKERGDDLLAYLRKNMQQRALNSDVLAWICRERAGKTAPLLDDDLPAVILANLERDHLGEGARRTNRLSEVLQSDPDLVPDLVRNADVNQVRGFVRRLMMCPAFDHLSMNSLLARVVKLHPGVQELITGEARAEHVDETLVVSWESLENRQQELYEIINVLQPKNREEIKVARSYGDLRENFEYKAAKQQEAVLRRQREDIERDLSRARGTDFSEVDPSRCSIGTVVAIQDIRSGQTDTFTILGAWDSNPEKGVIAYTTEAGKALVGKAVGEMAEMPTDEPNVTRTVRIVDISPYLAPAAVAT